MSKKISELPAATTLTDNDDVVVNHIDTSGTDPETITSKMTVSNLKGQLGINGKADKVSGGTIGNFAGIDSNGNLMDSGNKASDFLTLHQTIKQDGVTGATANRFGMCSTGASTAEKTVSITSGTLSLEAGVRITVLFENINTASTPTLNVNNTGAKYIYIGANQITGNYKGLIKGVIDFVYDGTYWQYIGSATLVKGSMEQLYSDGPVSLTAAAVGAIPALNRETSYNDTSDHVYSTGYVNDIVEDTISDAWVSGHSYSVGDYCIDENILYKCKTAHTSAAAYEPPYASYWDAVKVGDELKSLNSGLTNKLDIRKAYTSHTLIDTVTSNANGRYSKSISSLNTALGSYRSIALNTRGGDGDWFWFVMGHNPQLVSYILNTMNTGRFYILGFLQINGKGNNMEVDNSTAGQFDVSYANKTGYLYGFN